MTLYTLPATLLALLALFILPSQASITDCSSWNAILNGCASATPGFTTLAVSDQAPCYCYTSMSWAPDVYDGYFDGCISYLKTADPAELTSAGLDLNNLPSDPCLAVGDPVPCLEIDSVFSSCEAVTPGFSSITAASVLASCLCYAGTSWRPQAYDSALNSCRRYLKSHDSSYATQTLSTNDPCQTIGDVRANATPGGGSPTAAASTAAQPASSAAASAAASASAPGSSTATATAAVGQITTLSGYAACSTILALNSECAVQTPGFTTITAASSLASCLCYSGTTWQPRTYDNAWSSCASFLSVNDPKDFSSLLVGTSTAVDPTPCQGVGDVRATAKGTASATVFGGDATTSTSTLPPQTTTTSVGVQGTAGSSSSAPKASTSTGRRLGADVFINKWIGGIVFAALLAILL